MENNFNPIGNKPLAPTIYDENITPLESMNKLVFKINKLIGDDTNVKEVVDKLLDVYASHMKLQGGYCEELKCIAFENPISCGLEHTTSPIYTQAKIIAVGVNNVKGNVTFYQWQYKNDNGLFVDLEAQGSNTANCKIPVTFYNSGDKKEFRCKLQNDKYTYYTEAIVIEYIKAEVIIEQNYYEHDNYVDLYSKNKVSYRKNNFPMSNGKWEFNIGNGWVTSQYNNNEIYPYYYINKGSKPNGISVGTGEVGTNKNVQWRFTCTNNYDNSIVISNVITTTVHMIDFDCGSALFNGISNDNWNKPANMIQWYSYLKAYNSAAQYCDLSLSINKELNNDVVTSVQWLQLNTDVLGFTKEPMPSTAMENATDINESVTVEQEKSGYLWKSVYAFRLRVLVGNVSYYSKNVYVNTNLAKIDISQSPTININIGSTLTLTGSFNKYVPDNYDISNIMWFLSNNKNSWSSYSVYGDSKNIIKVKIYNDNASHIDGFGVNGGDALYVWASVNGKICGAKTVSINQS